MLSLDMFYYLYSFIYQQSRRNIVAGISDDRVRQVPEIPIFKFAKASCKRDLS